MIIITGARGFIGSNLVSALNKLGKTDLVLVDELENQAKNQNISHTKFKELIHRDDFIEWLQKNASKISFIFHLGARTDTTEQDKSIFDKLNFNYSKSIFEICTKSNIPLLYASSAATYGNGSLGYDDFKSLYANLLVSNKLVDDNNNELWFYNSFYKPLLNYIISNVPTETNVSNEASKVKIDKCRNKWRLSDFGFIDYAWFSWNQELDPIIIEEAKNKLDLEEWDIRDIVENADLEKISNWIENIDEQTYEAFIKELEESNLRIKTKEKLSKIKLFLFSDDSYKSLSEIDYNPKIYKFSIEIVKLGFGMPKFDISKFPNICSSTGIKPDREIYTLIAEKCKTKCQCFGKIKRGATNRTSQHIAPHLLLPQPHHDSDRTLLTLTTRRQNENKKCKII